MELQTQHEQWYRDGELPLFGLPVSYSGLRMIGDSTRLEIDDHDGHGPYLAEFSLGLAHGNPLTGTEPYLQVITAMPPAPEPAELLSAEAARPTTRIDLDNAAPVHVLLNVDGRPVPASGLQAGEAWAVRAEHQGVAIGVIAVRWPLADLNLVRISDPEPYLSGRADFVRRITR